MPTPACSGAALGLEVESGVERRAIDLVLQPDECGQRHFAPQNDRNRKHELACPRPARRDAAATPDRVPARTKRAKAYGLSISGAEGGRARIAAFRASPRGSSMRDRALRVPADDLEGLRVPLGPQRDLLAGQKDVRSEPARVGTPPEPQRPAPSRPPAKPAAKVDVGSRRSVRRGARIPEEITKETPVHQSWFRAS